MKVKSEFQWRIDHMKLNRIMRKNRKEGKKLYYVFLDFDGVLNVFFEPGTPEFEAMRKKIEDGGEFEFADRKCSPALTTARSIWRRQD